MRRVQPLTVIVAIRIEQVRITIGIARNATQTTTLRMLSGLNFIRHLECHSISHQVSSFFEVSACVTLFETVVANNLDAWILDSEAGNRNRPHFFLLPILF